MLFIGRTDELAYLNRLYAAPQGTLCIVYGRRRIGKTRLLTHWLTAHQNMGFYWLATDSSSALLLASLSQAVYQQLHGQAPAQAGFSYFDWDELFREIVRWIKGSQQKVILILDEFTYAIEAYPDLPHKLQAVWDHHLKDLPIMLVLSGSHIGMMEERVLAHRSPLYGRATGVLNLRQLPFKDVRAIFPRYDIESAIALYSVVGGVPYYLEQIDPRLSVVENIIQRVMASPVLVQDEPRLMLHDHFTQPGIYAAVLSQVAQGYHSPKEIAAAMDGEAGTVSNYLNTLVRLGLLYREIPATERHPERSRRSRYVLSDPFLRFYYRFLLPQLQFLVRGAYQAVWNTIEQHWRAFIGTHTFEELCREWVYVAAERGKLPFLPQVVGSHWGKTEQIDIVAINWDQAAVLYGECKWRRDTPVDLSEVEKLVERSNQIGLETRSGNRFQSHYIFFSRAGFTLPALTRIHELQAIAVDLMELEAVLAQAVR